MEKNELIRNMMAQSLKRDEYAAQDAMLRRKRDLEERREEFNRQKNIRRATEVVYNTYSGPLLRQNLKRLLIDKLFDDTYIPVG